MDEILADTCIFPKNQISYHQPYNTGGNIMTTKELIFKEIKKIPEPLIEEVLDFIRFLERKTLEQNMETAIASESSLRKDWLRHEEDKAWQDL